MFSRRERERYKRQMMLFGDEGQERLKKAHIFIAGAGGLESRHPSILPSPVSEQLLSSIWTWLTRRT